MSAAAASGGRQTMAAAAAWQDVVWAALFATTAAHAALLLGWFARRRHRSPIRQAMPVHMWIASAATALFAITITLNNLFAADHSVYVDCIAVGAPMALATETFLVVACRLYLAFNVTRVQLALALRRLAPAPLDDGRRRARIALRIRVARRLMSNAAGVAYVLARVGALVAAQTAFALAHPDVFAATPADTDWATGSDTRRLSEIATNSGAATAVLFALVACRLRLVVDAHGIKRNLTRVGVGAVVGFGAYYASDPYLKGRYGRVMNWSSLTTVAVCNLILALALAVPLYRSYQGDDDCGGAAAAANGVDRLELFLRQPPCFEAFKKHLMTEFSVENVCFWYDVEQFRVEFAPQSDRSTSGAAAIVKMYLASDAPLEVNLPNHLVDVFRQRSPLHLQSDMFDAASTAILNLMYSDSFPRFCLERPDVWDGFVRDMQEETVLETLNATWAKSGAAHAAAGTKRISVTPSTRVSHVSLSHVSTIALAQLSHVSTIALAHDDS